MMKIKTRKDGTSKFVLSETDLKHQIVAYFKLHRIINWYNLQGTCCYKGLPDREGINNGHHFYVEVKSQKGKLSPYQENFKAMVESEGEKFFVARDFDVFVNEFKQWRKEEK